MIGCWLRRNWACTRPKLTHEVESLHLYYLALSKQLDRQHTVNVAWSEERTVDWPGILRVVPYQDRFPVRDDTYRCPCAASAPSGFRDLTHREKDRVDRGAVPWRLEGEVQRLRRRLVGTERTPSEYFQMMT